MNLQIKTFTLWVREKKKACPKLAEEIQEFYQLALDEIEEGGSTTHEIELATSDIEELIKENCN